MIKEPQDCKSISDVRECIDSIDKQLVELIGKRYRYIKEIVKYKSNKEDVEAKPRYDEVLRVRRQWASQENIDPDVIEAIYKTMIQYFIEEQMKMLKKGK